MKYKKKTYRGEIWMTNLAKNWGSEQNGIRPCLILNQAKKNENTILAVPASSKIRPQSYRVNNYQFLIHQTRAIDTRRLIRLIERFDKPTTDKIASALTKFITKK